MPAEADLGGAEVTITLEDLVSASRELHRAEEERDRARALAAKLEEVVAMRTAVLKALVEMDNLLQLPAIQEWAAAQLSEVP